MAAGRLQAILRITATLIAIFGTSTRIILSLKSGYGFPILFYFTIQSNLMVCIFLIVKFLEKTEESVLSTIFHGGILLYILITGIVFNLILAPAIEARGINLLIMTINHTITPLLFLSDWLLFRKRKNLEWSHLKLWLIYPTIYLIAASIEGSITKAFRYPFLDFINHEPLEYITGLIIVTAIFIIVSAAIILIDKRLLNRSLKT